MLARAKVLQLIHNLGEATGLIDARRVHDPSEFYEACCDLFGIPQGLAYMDLMAIRNPTAFVDEYVRLHTPMLRELGWMQ